MATHTTAVEFYKNKNAAKNIFYHGISLVFHDRNITTKAWTRMAIDSLFERGGLSDWREFATELKGNAKLAEETLFMCERHGEKASAALARTLVEHFHPGLPAAPQQPARYRGGY